MDDPYSDYITPQINMSCTWAIWTSRGHSGANTVLCKSVVQWKG